MHKPIYLNNLSLSFPHKICFENFSTQIHYGARIGIIGQNGSGKSTLLNIIRGFTTPTNGTVQLPKDMHLGFVPQLIESSDFLSGGEKFNKALSLALRNDPNILLLDEPTNHLDYHNRKSLMRMLQHYRGTLVIISHDTELLRTCVDTLWHIGFGQVSVFSGHYDDYVREQDLKRNSLRQSIDQFNHQKDVTHKKLMKEQQRASKSKERGKKSIDQRKWPTVVSKAKVSRASETSGQKKAALVLEKQQLIETLQHLRIPEVITPKFSINPSDISHKVLIQINEGCLGYDVNSSLIKNINFFVYGNDRIAIRGNNGSGKTSFIKTILGNQNIYKSGDWILPTPEEIGYLDQHYKTLDPEKSVFETISVLVPNWSHQEVRSHLNDFLFRKNEEINALTKTLSGGEKARLSMAQIAARTPKLLILDEITNNLDIETKEHVIQVLKAYLGAIIIISHEEDFLKAVGTIHIYTIDKGKIIV